MYSRFQLLKKVATFTNDKLELKLIYTTFCRGVLEQSCEVWGDNLTEENRDDLERCQKVAVRLICDRDYRNYTSALEVLSLETLEFRRQKLSLRLAHKFTQHDQMKQLFPLNIKKHDMNTRKQELYKVTPANTDRFHRSAVIKMQAQLNELHANNKLR